MKNKVLIVASLLALTSASTSYAGGFRIFAGVKLAGGGSSKEEYAQTQQPPVYYVNSASPVQTVQQVQAAPTSVVVPAKSQTFTVVQPQTVQQQATQSVPVVQAPPAPTVLPQAVQVATAPQQIVYLVPAAQVPLRKEKKQWSIGPEASVGFKW